MFKRTHAHLQPERHLPERTESMIGKQRMRLFSLQTAKRGHIDTRLWPVRRHLAVSFICLLLASVAACTASSQPADEPAASIPAVTAVSAPSTVSEEVALVSGDRQLVLWAPPFFQAPVDAAATDPLSTLYEQFEREHPGVHIDVQIRAENGEAGILNYLRDAQRLAPAILPDIILLDAQQLWQAAELGLLMPLEQTELFTDSQFFPRLLPAATHNDQLIGLPYLADFVHSLYYKDQLPIPYTTWAEAFETEYPFIFAAGKKEEINEFVYLQYIGAGGSFATETLLDEERLQALFAALVQARAQEIIPDTVLELTSLERAWSAFSPTTPGILETSTHLVLEHWDAAGGETAHYIPSPTLNGTDVVLSRVWAFAIVATDPKQRELSVALLAAFMDATVHSELAHITMYAPTQFTAFESWRGSSTYFDFLRNHLDQTIPLPNGRRFSELNRRLQHTVELVLRNEMTAEEAVLYVQTTP